MKPALHRVLAIAMLIAASPTFAAACPMCFLGEDKANLVYAFTLGILTLVIPTFLILAWLTWVVVKSEIENARKEKLELEAGNRS